MKLGVVFPQTEIGDDPARVRAFVEAVEAMGFDYLTVYDHVLGAHPDRPDRLTGPYTHESAFYEPFVLYGYLAAFTRRIELFVGVLVLPQRQTALVAKQAATVDVLCGGRLRLGVGIGWNHVEFEALGMDFHTRGRRLAEQVALLRALWTEEIVDFRGRDHRVDRAGLNPMPVQRPIPLWIGGTAPPMLRRAVRLGDGWIASSRLGYEDSLRARDLLRAELATVGRDPNAFGLAASIPSQNVSPEGWTKRVRGFRESGFSHAHLVTMNAGLTSVEAHIEAVRRFREAAGAA